MGGAGRAQRLTADMEADKAHYKAYGKVMPLLTTVAEELPDVPFFMTLHNMASILKVRHTTLFAISRLVLQKNIHDSRVDRSPPQPLP